MSDVFLLSPWAQREYVSPQTSLLYLKYYLADHGYEARIIDCSRYDRDYDQVMAILGGGRRPIIGVTAYTRERFHAARLIQRIKAEIPESVIVAGGRHFGSLARETLEALPEVDIVARGEGEITMKEICDVARQGGDFKEVLGITYRDGGEIRVNADRPLEEDLDRFRSFDPADRETLEGCVLTSTSKVDETRKYFSVMATRGCPNRCVYCSLTATKVRYRSIESILEEIEQKIELTGVRSVSFADSSLTINRHFVEAFCKGILDRNLDIRFNCYSRVNIDLDLLKLMKKAGLVSVEIGLESGSPRILKAIRKNINLDQFRRFCRLARELGIKVYVFCMVSLPEERPEDVDLTLSLIREVSKYIYYVGVQTTRILPDAALHALAREKGVLPPEFSWFEPYELPEGFSPILKDPMYKSIPLYLEHMSVDEVTAKLEEFRRLLDTHLSSVNVLRKAMRYNLSREGLRQLTPGLLEKKVRRFSVMAYHALRNLKKERDFG